MLFVKNKNDEYDIRKEFKYGTCENESTQAYIENRVLAQIHWYDKSSVKNQKKYKRYMVISAILSACIPVLTLLIDLPVELFVKITITLLSSGVSIISATLGLCNHKDLWIQYRSNCEILKSILHRFYTSSGEFEGKDDSEKQKVLVTTCEDYMTKEFQTWDNLHTE